MLLKRKDLCPFIVEALKANCNCASIPEVARYIWTNYKDELCAAGDLFYTWQYEMRWAAGKLREDKVMKSASESRRGFWELS
jgi:hypothetical protein